MAYTTESSYTGNGSTTDFLVTFPFLESTDVKARVNGVDTSAFTITGTTVTFTTAPPNTQAVLLYRDTDIDKAKVVYHAGSAIRAQDLNNTSKQLLYAIQEEEQSTGGVAFDTGNKGQISVNTANSWVINNDVITEAMMTNNSIDSDQYVDGSIDRLHLAADIVDGTKIADDSINSEHYVDASIDHVHLSNDCIDGDNIQNDVINSEHYAADSIDAEHYAPGSVDTTAIANNAVTIDKLAASIGTNPVGTVIWYAGNTAPTGYLKANGDTIANGSGTTQGITADFSALHAVIGATLPDLRGEFIRGWDDGKGTDSGRTIRSAQTDDFKSHQHTSDGARFGSNTTYPGTNFYSSAGDNTSNNVVSSVNATGGTETRPRNVALLACIKY